MKNANDLLRSDPYIQELYRYIFERMSVYLPAGGQVLEVGSGTGISHQYLGGSVLTDIVYDKSLNVNNAAENLPFADGCFDAIVLKDALHHVPEVRKFFDEAIRVLRPEGSIVIFEPYWGLLARLVYRYIHQESYDDKAESWEFESSHPWDSNQAVSFILLRRDRAKFEHEFPQFRIEEREVLIGPSFLLSGGVSRRTCISGHLLKSLLAWEKQQTQWFNHLRFFHIFTLAKEPSRGPT
jgi:SAM-dependent methyltransferase